MTIGAKVAAALVAAQNEFKTVHKSHRNEGQGYNYASMEDFVAAAQPVLSAHSLGLVVNLREAVDLPARQTQNGAQMNRIRVTVDGILLHESGESMTFSASGDGEDPTDKAIYKAQTGARKYLYANIMGVATSDDPESEQGAARLSPGPTPVSAPTPTGVVNQPATSPAKPSMMERLEERAKGAPPAPPEDPAVREMGLSFDKWQGYKLFKKDDSPTFGEAVANGDAKPLKWMVENMDRAPKAVLKAKFCLWLIAANAEEEAEDQMRGEEEEAQMEFDATRGAASDDIPF